MSGTNIRWRSQVQRDAEQVCAAAVNATGEAYLTLLRARQKQLEVKEVCDKVIAAADEGKFLGGDDLRSLLHHVTASTQDVVRAHSDYVDTVKEAQGVHATATAAVKLDEILNK